MKKTFLLIGCLLLLGIGVIGISCKKESKGGCTCSAKYEGQTIPDSTFKISAADTEGYSCSEITKETNEYIQTLTVEQICEEFEIDEEDLPENFNKAAFVISCK